MNTTQLECFLAVAQYLNFSKAAEAVRITQPAVSHQIQTLEEELGIRLFTRTSKSVSLTHAGMQFIGDAATILKIAGTARARLSDQQAQQAIYLGIGCHNQHELDLIPSMIQRLTVDYPTLRPSLRLVPAQVMENLLENETIQVMFSFYNEQKQTSVGTYQEFCKCPVVCLCSPSHPLAGASSLTEAELQGNTILCGPYRGAGILFELHSRSAMGRPASQVFIADGYESCIALIQAGLGYALFPYLPSMKNTGLRCIPMRDLAPASFGVYTKSTDQDVVRRFLEIARDELHAVEKEELP